MVYLLIFQYAYILYFIINYTNIKTCSLAIFVIIHKFSLYITEQWRLRSWLKGLTLMLMSGEFCPGFCSVVWHFYSLMSVSDCNVQLWRGRVIAAFGLHCVTGVSALMCFDCVSGKDHVCKSTHVTCQNTNVCMFYQLLHPPCTYPLVSSSLLLFFFCNSQPEHNTAAHFKTSEDSGYEFLCAFYLGLFPWHNRQSVI